MSENKTVEKPKLKKKKITRPVSPPGSRHPTPFERMEFVKWFMEDEIQDMFKGLPRYKMREKIIEKYKNDFQIKIGTQFMIGLDEGQLTKTVVDGEEEYKLAREFVNPQGEVSTFCLKEYCLHPFKVLKKMQKTKR